MEKGKVYVCLTKKLGKRQSDMIIGHYASKGLGVEYLMLGENELVSDEYSFFESYALSATKTVDVYKKIETAPTTIAQAANNGSVSFHAAMSVVNNTGIEVNKEYRRELIDKYAGNPKLSPPPTAYSLKEFENDGHPLTFLYFQKEVVGVHQGFINSQSITIEGVVIERIKFTVDYKIGTTVAGTNAGELPNEVKELAKKSEIDLETAKTIWNILTVRYMLIPEYAMEVCRKWKKYPAKLKTFIPDINTINYVDGGEMVRVLGYICSGKGRIPNGRLVGAQSSGKNTLINQINALLQKPELNLSMHRDTAHEEIEGSETIAYEEIAEDVETIYMQLLQARGATKCSPDEQGRLFVEAKKLAKSNFLQKISFADGPLVTAMEHGCAVVFDEVNMPLPSVLSRYHAALDYRGKLLIEKRGDAIEAEDGFFMIGTMNPTTYAGTQEMNTATESRFSWTVKCEPPEDIKSILVAQCSGASKEDIAIVAKIYSSVYNSVKSDDLPDAFISIRNYLATLNNRGWSSLKQSCVDHISCITMNDPENCEAVEQIINTIVR